MNSADAVIRLSRLLGVNFRKAEDIISMITNTVNITLNTGKRLKTCDTQEVLNNTMHTSSTRK